MMSGWWFVVAAAFLVGLTMCYWQRAWAAAVHGPTWRRPDKEPVEHIAVRLNDAVDRLESVHGALTLTVEALRTHNGRDLTRD